MESSTQRIDPAKDITCASPPEKPTSFTDPSTRKPVASACVPTPKNPRSTSRTRSPVTVLADSNNSDTSSETSTSTIRRSHQHILDGIHHPKPKRKFSTTSELFTHPLAKSPSRESFNYASSIQTQASSSSHEALDSLTLETVSKLRTTLVWRTRELERKDKDIADLIGELMTEQSKVRTLKEAREIDLQEKLTLLKTLEKAYRELKQEKVWKICKLEVCKLERMQRGVRDSKASKWSDERDEVEAGGSKTCQDMETSVLNLEARVWASEAEMGRQDAEIEILEKELALDKAAGGKMRGTGFRLVM